MKSEPKVCDYCPFSIQTVSVSETGILAQGDRQGQGVILRDKSYLER